MRDIGEYLSEEETWRVGVKCQRENLMAEEATAMRSVIKRETPRKTRKVLLRATRINIGIVFPNLQDDIPFPLLSLLLSPSSLSLSLSSSSPFSLASSALLLHTTLRNPISFCGLYGSSSLSFLSNFLQTLDSFWVSLLEGIGGRQS